uniref:C10 family peptidase n=1 Tax=Prevotella sp. TaxID=59823 RepID=UPI004024BE5F
AIVMKHHGYPAKGTGSHSYTWNGKTLTANFEHDYDWASMPAKYDGTNDAAFDGVARLMADLGVAVEMQYSKSGSGAYIGNMISALQKYFGYSKLTYLASIDDMEAEAWNAKLRGEIDANRPILYSASDASAGGHSFIIDGYKDESFSVNWGWGGYCNGFYQIGALNPESAGKPTGDKYNLGQTAVIGLQPSDGTEKVSTMGFLKVAGQLQALNMNVTDVKKGQRGAIFSVPLGNTGDRSFTGEVVVALMNAKGEMREIVTSKPFKLTDFAPGYYNSSLSFSIESKVDAEPGDYLAIMAKEDGLEEYIELYDPTFERMRLPATGYEPRTYEIRTKVGEGATIKQAETWYNPSTNFYNGKPVIGSYYCYYLTLDAGIANCCVELNGKLVNYIRLGTERPNSFRGLEPVYTLEVKTYRDYQEKELVINLEKAGTLKQALANENPDYFVYRNIKVNGEIDKRDFDELASHYFKSIDLSGAKVVAYDYFKADMVPDCAFEGNEYLESFKMPAGVKKLGFNAFRATMLKEIDLPETIEEFGLNTFNYCFNLTDVYMRHKEAPYWISWCVFASKFDVYRTLHLYPGSKAKYEAYQYTKNWIVYFDNVVEDLEPTGIHSVTLDKETGNKAIYDLNGRRITEAMKKGVYIKNGKKISAR